ADRRRVAKADRFEVIHLSWASFVPAMTKSGWTGRADPLLPLEPAVGEERLFFRCGGAAEHRVAMRKTAEPLDDVEMQVGPFQALGVTHGAEQGDAALLVGDLLRVL